MQKTQSSIFLLTLIICLITFNSNASKKLRSSKTVSKETLEGPALKAEDQKVKSILKEAYPIFMRSLGENIKDHKFRDAIRSLASHKKVNFKKLAVPVMILLPTQNEIDVDKSLKYTLTNVASAKAFLECSEPIKIMGLSIVTSAYGKYVIDGHHRWSQVMSINPDCEMAAIDLTDVKDPMNALKSTQLGIAAGKDKNGNEISSIPVSVVKGRNLLKICEEDLKAYVVKTLTDDVLDVFNKFDPSLSCKEEVAQYIWENVQSMQENNQPVTGAPNRGLMPQTDLVVNWKDNAVNVDLA